MKPDGYNPLRWDCEKQGCFNKKCRPKIEIFADCFPRRINFGDVDGLVEINGKGLLLEWKSVLKDIPTGQKIAYQKLTQGGSLTVSALLEMQKQWKLRIILNSTKGLVLIGRIVLS
jgi:hypothetical protein